MDGVSFVSCSTWIKRGICKKKPEKVEVTKDELARIIQETRGRLRDTEEIAEEDDTAAGKRGGDEDVEGDSGQQTSDDLYNLDKYDEDEGEEGGQNFLALGDMTEFASNADDPYVTLADACDSDSEAGDLEVQPEENMIITGQVDGDASNIIFYVFNEDEGSIYVHHDILISSFPVCVEWLNFESAQGAPGNLVAVGSMSPVIEVWDVDVVDSIEPAYRLGRKGRKKKPGLGHTDAVLSLAWNRQLSHVMASGSADKTVLLWDLETRQNSSILQCKEKVQSLAWHPQQPDQLLSGDCSGSVRVWECRSESKRGWKVQGEVEQAVWDHFSPTGLIVSTDLGTLHYVDVRTDKRPVWSVQAHEDSCTGVCLSPEVPGCLVSVSADGQLNVWDVGSALCPAGPLASRDLKLGALHALSACPDLPWMFAVGGDNRDHNFRVFDIREMDAVRSCFGGRPLRKVLPELDVADPAVAMETESATTALQSMALDNTGLDLPAAAKTNKKKPKKREKVRRKHR